MFLLFCLGLATIMLLSWAWRPLYHSRSAEATACCQRFVLVAFRPAIWQLPGFLMWVVCLQMCSLGLLTLYYHVVGHRGHTCSRCHVVVTW